MDISDCSAIQKSDVDITECGNLRDEIEKEEEVLCEPSCSSSFGDSMCACARDGDEEEEEAQSMLSKDYPLPDDSTEFLGLKKKKLTDQWRVFSQLLAWRCKWLELKVKEIQSQARVYDKEVQSYYENKEFDLEKAKFLGLEGKSVPFHQQNQRTQVFKRRRRKRVEDTSDVAAYFSNHNVFSYAEKRIPATLKAPDFGSARKAKTSKEDDIENDCLAYCELDCSDNNFLVKLLCKIDEAQERAKRLRKRLDQLPHDKQTLVVMPHTVAGTTVQIGRQRISADHHNEDVLMMPPVQCLNNNSPISSGGFIFHPILEDLLMDEPEMNGDETEMDEEKLDYFEKLINEITRVPTEEADGEEDVTPVDKRG